MSDLSLNVSSSNLHPTKAVDQTDEPRRARVPPLLLKKIEKIGKYGKSLGVDSQIHPAAESGVPYMEENEPLIFSASATASGNNSPLSISKQYQPRASPQMKEHLSQSSPQPSPNPIANSLSAFSLCIGIDQSQTDETGADKKNALEETGPQDDETSAATSVRQTNLSPRMQLDSMKEELEAIDEQVESIDSPVTKESSQVCA